MQLYMVGASQPESSLVEKDRGVDYEPVVCL